MARSSHNIDLVINYTKSDRTRLESMVEAIEDVERNLVFGDVVEVGAWRGGNIMLTKLMAPKRICWLYDTFEGMTVPDPVLDVKRSGEKAIDRYNSKLEGGTKWDAVSLDEVKQGFADVGISTKHINFIVGAAEETVMHTAPLSIAILRLDVDWYKPTKAALEKLYPRISPGGFLIVDDYGHWMGCKKAIDDYFDKDVPIYYDADYSCRIFRVADEK